MSKNRYATNKDKNEPQLVIDLRGLGVSVEQNHDDLLCGFQGLTFWYELKSENAIKADGTINEKAIKKSQKKIRSTWRGHYKIASSLEQIIDDMNESFKRYGLRTVRIK
ncbi:MAG: hypothetical protein GWP06_06125 [Actinobacteria bacterium]|nr:hypothetical protein [Actinomycetota bacterium]